MNAFEFISDYFTTSEASPEATTSTSNQSLQNDSDNESECSNSSLEGFDAVSHKEFDLWDDSTDLKKPKKKVDKSNLAVVPYHGPFDPMGEFVSSLNHNEPEDTTLSVNPQVIDLLVASLSGSGPSSVTAEGSDCMALVPWKPNAIKKRVAKGQAVRYRSLYVQARKRLTELRKDLAVCEDTLEIKNWMLESLAEELKHAKHDNTTLTMANETLYKNNKNLQKGFLQQSKLAVSAATAAAKATVVQNQTENFCKDIMSLNETIWTLKEEKRTLEEQKISMSTEISELKAFVSIIQADLDNLILNLVSNGMVLATDSQGKKITLSRLNVPIEESNWSCVKTRKDEVKYMAIISGHEAAMEKVQNRIKDLLLSNDTLQNEKEALRVTVRDCETKITQMEQELAAEKCMSRMICADLEDAQVLIDSLRDSKDRTESQLMKEKRRNAELERELLKCEKQLLARVDSLEHAMEASKLVKRTTTNNARVRTSEQFAQTHATSTDTCETGAQATCATTETACGSTALTFRPCVIKKPLKRLSTNETASKALLPFDTKRTVVESLKSSCMRKAFEMASNCWDLNKEEKSKDIFVFNDSLPETTPAQKWVMEEMFLSSAKPETKQPKSTKPIMRKVKKAAKKTMVASLIHESVNPEAEELEKAQLVLAENQEEHASKKPRLVASSDSGTLFGSLFDEPEIKEPAHQLKKATKLSKKKRSASKKQTCNVSLLAAMLEKREGNNLTAPASELQLNFDVPNFSTARPIVRPFNQPKSTSGLIAFDDMEPKTKVTAVPEVTPGPVGRDSLMDLDLDALFGSSPFDFAPLTVTPSPAPSTSFVLPKVSDLPTPSFSWEQDVEKEIEQLIKLEETAQQEESQDEVYSLESLFDEAANSGENSRPKKSSKRKDKARHASRIAAHSRQSARPYQRHHFVFSSKAAKKPRRAD